MLPNILHHLLVLVIFIEHMYQQSIEPVRYVITTKHNKLTKDIKVRFELQGVFNVCYHEATLGSGSVSYEGEWESLLDCGHIENMTVSNHSDVIYEINHLSLDDGRDIYESTQIENGSAISMRRICLAGWKPEYCESVIYKVSVDTTKKRTGNIVLCKDDSFTLTFNGSLDLFRVSFENVYKSGDTVTKTIERPDIGTLEEVVFDPNICGDFQLGVIILESDVNIFYTYGGFNTNTAGVQYSKNIRITCKTGSRVFVCNHIMYSINVDGDVKFDQSSKIIITGDRGSFETSLKKFSGNDNMGIENPNIADVKDVTLRNTEISRPIQLVVGDIRREYHFACQKTSVCKLTSTVCKLGWHLGNCDTIEVRIIVRSYGTHNMSLRLSSKLGLLDNIQLNGESGSIGGIYRIKLMNISQIAITNEHNETFNIIGVTLHYANYEIKPQIGVLTVNTTRIIDVTRSKHVCLWRWTSGDICDKQQMIAFTNWTGEYLLVRLEVSFLARIIFINFSTKGKRVTIIPDSVTVKNYTRINSVEITGYGKTNNPKTTLKLYNAIQVYEITKDISAVAKKFSVSDMKTTCNAGLSGDKCMSFCQKYTHGRGCRPCQCKDDPMCDPMSGWCSSGRCKLRFASPYCDWTCEEGHYGLQCEHFSMRGGNCENSAGICDKGCVKVNNGTTCSKFCDGVYGLVAACVKQCHCDKNVLCDPQSGECPQKCHTGYYNNEGEVDCQGMCSPWTFGENCSKTCFCKNNATCDFRFGNCPSGCASGRSGTDCQTKTVITKEVFTSIKDIAIYVGAGVSGLVVVGMAVFTLMRHRAKKSRQHHRYARSGKNYQIVKRPTNVVMGKPYTAVVVKQSANVGNEQMRTETAPHKKGRRNSYSDTDIRGRSKSKRPDDSDDDSPERGRSKTRGNKSRDDDTYYTSDETPKKKKRKAPVSSKKGRDRSLSESLSESEILIKKKKESKNRREESVSITRQSERRRKSTTDADKKSMAGKSRKSKRAKSTMRSASTVSGGMGLYKSVSFGQVLQKTIDPIDSEQVTEQID